MQEVWTETGIYVLNRVFVRGIPSKVKAIKGSLQLIDCLKTSCLICMYQSSDLKLGGFPVCR